MSAIASSPPVTADRATRQREVVAALRKVLPDDCLLWHDEDTTPYE